MSHTWAPPAGRAARTIGALAASILVNGLASCTSFGEGPTAGDGGRTEDAASTGDAGAEDLDAGDAGAAVAIASGEPELGRIVAGASYVFYTQNVVSGAIKRLQKKPSATAEVVFQGTSPTALATSGGILFATSSRNDAVASFDVTTNTLIKSAVLGGTAPTAIAADPVGVVFLESAGADPGAYSLPSTLTGTPSNLTTSDGPTALAIDDKELYVSFSAVQGAPRIRHRTRSAGATTSSADLGGVAVALEVDRSWVYLGIGGRILTLPLGFAMDAVPTLIHDFGTEATVTSIRATGAYIFVATQGAAGGTVHRLDTAATGMRAASLVSKVSDEECKLPDMAVDTDTIYFLCNSAAGVGSVWKVARPLK